MKTIEIDWDDFSCIARLFDENGNRLGDYSGLGLTPQEAVWALINHTGIQQSVGIKVDFYGPYNLFRKTND